MASGARRLLVEGVATGGDPAAALVGMAALVAALIAGWLTSTLFLSIVARLPGRVGRCALHLRDRVTPAVVRRWAAIALGASMTACVLPGTAVAAVRTPQVSVDSPAPGWVPSASTAGPASTPRVTRTEATSPGWSSSTAARQPTATPPSPGWTPRRPAARHRTDPTLLTGAHRADTDDDNDVVVRRGDSLWSITAARLGPEATAAEVAQAWPRWHAANAARIGPDPHLLLPGTRLSPPDHHHDPGTIPATKGTR
ncbi:hypothetical protein ASG73_08585 [Janibacter sp. Soil728]|nr:hypothetical protein ASG73_08585 [Janibacter sp. Soil728]